MRAVPIVIILLIALVALVTLALSSSQNSATVRVKIPGLGVVLGNYDTTQWTNATYMQFRGIPYAESPSAELRFKAPISRRPWTTPLDATNYGRRCPVISTVSKLSPAQLAEDLEDCLNLCVYTKDLSGRMPVMFYIYGGGFYNGSSSDHPPKYLLEADVVLVVPQYRIGAVGWLTTFTPEMPGNSPVADVLLALQWVQDHITTFGGDPSSVTIFGQSAGAAVSGALLVSPKTPEELFQRAILQSGSILADWALNKDPLGQVLRLCQALGCTNCGTKEEQHRCLSAAALPRLLEVTTAESFSPVYGDLNGILPQHPAVLGQQVQRPVPMMTGFTRHDGSFILATYYDALKRDVGNLTALSVRQFSSGIMDMLNDTTRLSNNLLTRTLLTPDLLQGTDHKAALPAYFDLTNVVFMKSPVIALTAHWVQRAASKVYLYSFDYEGANTRFGYEFGNSHYPFNGGAHHSNDNIYLFSTHTLNEEDTQIARRMVSLWTSFAIHGVPSGGIGSVPIPHMKSESGPYFRINRGITIGTDVLEEFTATLDDPQSDRLDRNDIEF